MNKNITRFLAPTGFMFVMFFTIILSTGKFSYAVTEGISLFALTVLPASFPYFFITAILSSMELTGKISSKLSPITKKLFNTGGVTGYALFMSIISGYPLGAKIVSDLREENLISEEEAIRASSFCSTSSPSFLIGCVGSLMFKSTVFGLYLFLSHILSAFTVGIIFSFYKRKSLPLKGGVLHAKKTDAILYESAFSSAISVLVVGSIITVFYTLTEIIFSLKILDPIINLLALVIGKNNASGLVMGIIECTKGYSTLSANVNNFSLSLCVFLAGFGGISVIMQSIAYLKKAKIKTATFLIAKILCAVLGVIYSIPFSFLLS